MEDGMNLLSIKNLAYIDETKKDFIKDDLTNLQEPNEQVQHWIEKFEEVQFYE